MGVEESFSLFLALLLLRVSVVGVVEDLRSSRVNPISYGSSNACDAFHSSEAGGSTHFLDRI